MMFLQIGFIRFYPSVLLMSIIFIRCVHGILKWSKRPYSDKTPFNTTANYNPTNNMG